MVGNVTLFKQQDESISVPLEPGPRELVLRERLTAGAEDWLPGWDRLQLRNVDRPTGHWQLAVRSDLHWLLLAVIHSFKEPIMYMKLPFLCTFNSASCLQTESLLSTQEALFYSLTC